MLPTEPNKRLTAHPIPQWELLGNKTFPNRVYVKEIAVLNLLAEGTK